MQHIIRTGDTVVHRPSGEKWTVAYADYETGRLAACGYPDGEARIADCDLVKACSDHEYMDLIAELAVSGDRRGERAARIASKEIGSAPGFSA